MVVPATLTHDCVCVADVPAIVRRCQALLAFQRISLRKERAGLLAVGAALEASALRSLLRHAVLLQPTEPAYLNTADGNKHP